MFENQEYLLLTENEFINVEEHVEELLLMIKDKYNTDILEECVRRISSLLNIATHYDKSGHLSISHVINHEEKIRHRIQKEYI